MSLTRAPRLDEVGLATLLERQEGVVCRAQVRALGGDDVDVRRKIRRREWAQVHPGVYVHHSGPLSQRQRLWAAVLLHWPAAVHRESALALHGLRQDRARSRPEDPVRLVIDASRRTPAAVPGISVERVQRAQTWLVPHRQPPRVELEFALLKVASERDLPGAIALLADACQQRRTDVSQLLRTLDQLGTLPGRAALLQVLLDVASGAHSVLEHRYLRDVERAHGLPVGQRQVLEQSGDRMAIRDVKYADQALVVELDGRFGHTDSLDRWADLDRDLQAAVRALMTVRLGWAQVLAPCRVAQALVDILRARGWTALPRGCGRGCDLGVRGQ